MGLLDGLNLSGGIDPQTALLLGLGSGLLGTVGQGRRATFGEALSAGLQSGTQSMRQAIADRQRAEQLAAEERMRQQQLEMQRQQMDAQRQQMELQRQQAGFAQAAENRAQAQFEAAEAQRKRNEELQGLAANFIRTPEQQAMQQFGGPTQAAAQAVSQFKPSIDMPAFQSAVMSRDWQQGLALQDRMRAANAPIKIGKDDRLLDPQTRQQLVGPVADMTKPFYMDANNQLRANPEVQAYELARARAGGTQVNVPVNTEKTWAGNIAEGLAKRDIGIIEAADAAPTQIATAQRVKQLLGDPRAPITGSAQEVQQKVERALVTARLIDGQRLANTEALMAELAKQTLANIRSSGLGAGSGFTNTDREYLEKASSGNLTFTKDALYRLADLNEQAARSSLAKGITVANQFRNDPKLGSVGQRLQFAEPPKMAPLPLPGNAGAMIKGAVYATPQGAYRWDGMRLVKED